MTSAQQDAQSGALPDADMLHHSCRQNLEASERQNANLRIALSSARRIGVALGILMATRKITDDQAFALLSRASQVSNLKVRDLAEHIILTGDLT